MQLNYIPLTKENLYKALLIAKEIFPYDSDDIELSYTRGLDNDSTWRSVKILEHYLVINSDTDEVVAITGIYQKNTHPLDEIWLSWFGVNPKFRRQGIGKKVLELTMNLARDRGYKHFNLWTSDWIDEVAAQKLYDDLGIKVYKSEPGDEYTTIYRSADLA